MPSRQARCSCKHIITALHKMDADLNDALFVWFLGHNWGRADDGVKSMLKTILWERESKERQKQGEAERRRRKEERAAKTPRQKSLPAAAQQREEQPTRSKRQRRVPATLDDYVVGGNKEACQEDIPSILPLGPPDMVCLEDLVTPLKELRESNGSRSSRRGRNAGILGLWILSIHRTVKSSANRGWTP